MIDADELPIERAPGQLGEPTRRRALATLGVCFAVMIVFLMICLSLPQIPPLPVVSALNALLTIVPTLIAFYWPKPGAPGAPPYKPLSRGLVVAIACLSLPLYAVFAGLQIAIAVHMRVPTTGLAGALAIDSPFQLLWLALSMALLPALAEELLFRGMLQRAAVARFGARWGIIGTAALFAFLHLELSSFLPLLCMGIWLGYLAWRSGSLWASSWAHALNNFWGIAVANLPWLNGHVGWIAGASMVALGGGLVALRQSELAAQELPLAVPALPHFIPVRRGDPPK